MLTSSPVAPRATNASPRTFHYASSTTTTTTTTSAAVSTAATYSTCSPRQPPRSPKSPRVIAPLARCQSKQSFSRPSPAELRSPSSQARLSKQYVGVDAATQYSPMEPFDPTVPLRAASPSHAGPRISHPAKTATTASVAPALPCPDATTEPPPEPNISPEKPGDPRTNPLSPGKRRKSHDLASAQPSDSVVAASQPSSPKRAKPNQGPPKVLPLRYELCDVEDMVVLIANMLSELIETNDSIAMKSGQLTRFHSRCVHIRAYSCSLSPFLSLYKANRHDAHVGQHRASPS